MSTIFTSVLAFLTAFFSDRYFTRNLRQTQQASIESNLQIVGAELDLAFERVMSFANWTTVDTSISSYLNHMNYVDPAIYSRSDRLLSFTVWQLLNQEYIATGRNNEIQRVVLMTREGTYHLQCLQGTSQPSYIDVQNNLMRRDWFQTLANDDGYLWLLEQNPFYTSDRLFFPVVRPIERSTSSDVVGYVFLEISPDVVLNSLSSVQLNEDSALYLTLNGENAPTYEYRNHTLTPAELPEGLVSCRLPRTGFTLSMLPSGSLFRSQRRHYLGITLLIFAAVFLSGIALSQILRRMIARPVTALLSKTSRVGAGDFSRDSSIEWNNEFGDIGRGLNDLSENVAALMDRKLQDEKQKQELEYQILQSQINPHFLYNTLNTIKWMATIQGSEGIAEMSTALSRLLRNVSKNTRTLIPLKDELTLVQDYFTIMKYRYGGTIELEVQVSEDLYDLLVNRFSLQPIVENAIFHGIEPKGSAGTIVIHAYTQPPKDTASAEPARLAEGEAAIDHSDAQAGHPDQHTSHSDQQTGSTLLCIDVTDNGIGMDEATCRKVLSPDAQETTDFFRHVGISNVNQRIQYAFGAQYGLSIHSTPGSYTTVTMTLPACTTPPEAG